MEIEVEEFKTAENAMEKEIDDLTKKFTSFEKVEGRASTDKDVVVMDFEGSVDGEHWQVCGGHDDLRVCSPHTDSVNQKFRFLRIRFKEGIQGIWEWNLY